jgi:EC042_2821-lke REase
MVAKKPKGAKVQIALGGPGKPGDGRVVPVRLTDDPGAPVVRALVPDRTHPFRQKELLTELNARLPEARREVTGHDIQCVRKVYGIDGKAEYSHKPLFGSRQYSQAFLYWMVERSMKDRAFFSKARKKAKDIVKTQAKVSQRPR